MNAPHSSRTTLPAPVDSPSDDKALTAAVELLVAAHRSNEPFFVELAATAIAMLEMRANPDPNSRTLYFGDVAVIVSQSHETQLWGWRYYDEPAGEFIGEGGFDTFNEAKRCAEAFAFALAVEGA